MAAVTLTNVYKIYSGDVTAVRDFNLTINDGEFLVLVGPSGCGKSTTLRMIAGLEEISKGEVRIGDRVVNDVPPKDRDIAMVFQNYALYPHMTVYDNMAFGLKLRKFSKAEIHKRVTEAAAILGLEDYLDRRPKAMSGGQRQRVAVGRAIVRQPSAFLFDEPLSNLDAKMRVQMRVEINRLHANLETTMIYVTHDQVEAMTMGDRIVVMKDGVIQQVDDPISLYDNPANRFVASFIGTPPMNFLAGTIRIEDGKAMFDGGETQLLVAEAHQEAMKAYAGKKISFGIRPENIKATGVDQVPANMRIKALLDVTEPMGSETFWYLKSGPHSFIARVEAHVRAQNGDAVTVSCNMEKAHYFDDATEALII